MVKNLPANAWDSRDEGLILLQYSCLEKFRGHCAVLCLVTQSCPTLYHCKDCSPPRSSVRGDSPGNNTGVGCHALPQRIFPIQGSKPGLPHCRQILYPLSHQGSPRILESLLQGIFLTQELTGVSCIAGWFFTSWPTREAWAQHIHSINSIHMSVPTSQLLPQPPFPLW